MDLKIPKALSNRVFNNGYSKLSKAGKGFENSKGEITVTASISKYDLGDKVEENDKRTCLEKKKRI